MKERIANKKGVARRLPAPAVSAGMDPPDSPGGLPCLPLSPPVPIVKVPALAMFSFRLPLPWWSSSLPASRSCSSAIRRVGSWIGQTGAIGFDQADLVGFVDLTYQHGGISQKSDRVDSPFSLPVAGVPRK